MAPASTYSYAELEKALGKTFDLTPAQATGPLRGRLKHLQRLGIGAGVGKGKRWQYPKEIAQQWLICLLLEQLGLDPTVAANAVKANWEKILSNWMDRAVARQAVDTNNHVILLIRSEMMTASWTGGPGLTLWMDHFRDASPVPANFTRYSMLTAYDVDQNRPLTAIDITIYVSRLNLNLPR